MPGKPNPMRFVCPDCGNKKSPQALRCASCAGTVRQQEMRPDPTPEEIAAMRAQIRAENGETCR